MKTRYAALVLCAALAACSNPKDAVIPQDPAKMDAIKDQLQKLAPEEKELLMGYVMRKAVSGILSSALTPGEAKDSGIPPGTTIGQAIEDQVKFKAEQARKAEEAKALAAKLKAERDAALAKMRDAVTVALVSKKLVKHGPAGMAFDENLVVVFGYKNQTDREIAGIKGTLIVKDLFGDKLSAFAVSNDQSIAPGGTVTWTGSRSTSFSMGNQDRKLAELPDDKFTVEWEPEMIVFKDGQKLTAPAGR